MGAKSAPSDLFYRLLQRAVRDIDQKSIEAEVNALRKKKPRASRRELANYVTRRAATKTATVGAAASTATGPAALLALIPDIFNLVRQQSRLVLAIAHIYGQTPSVRERLREVLITLGLASGASITKKGAQYLLTRKLRNSAARQLARKIAGRLVARRISAVVAPAIGFVIGGTVNYLSVRAVGLAAQRYYSGLSRQKKRRRGDAVTRRRGERPSLRRPVTPAARSSRPSSRRRHARPR